MSKTVKNRLIEVEKKIVHDEAIEKAHQEFLDYIQYLIDHPQPNRNIHDFESEDLMTRDILKRIQALENDEVIEIEDISMYEREIFGEETIADDEQHNSKVEKA